MNQPDEYAHLESARLAGATIYGIADDGTLHVVGKGALKPQYICAPDRYLALVPYDAHLVQNDGRGETCRFFASGPEGYFFSQTLFDAMKLLDMLNIDADDWTVTDLLKESAQ